MADSRAARDALRAVRFRSREIVALDAARDITHETVSAFMRRAALGEARRVIEAEATKRAEGRRA
jgi:uncharacterized protein (DUF1778 family)